MPRPGTPRSVGSGSSAQPADPGARSRPWSTPYERFLLWERTSRDTLVVKRAYIDMAGDLVPGIVLSQIVYWHLPDRDGHSRLRVEREGKFWLAKSRTEWWDECRVTPRQVDRALQVLRDRGAIETRLFRFNGAPTVHLRLDEAGFMALWEAHASACEDGNAVVRSDFTQTSKSISPKRENPSSRNVEVHLPESASSSTCTTTEHTTGTTTTGSVTEAPAEPDVVVALLDELAGLGVTRKRAQRLIAAHGSEAVRRQAACISYRKADDPAAALVRAIEEDWAPPAAYRKAVAEREKKDRQRQRSQEKASERAEAAAAEEAARTAQDDWWNALQPGDQEELSAKAEEALRATSPFLFSRGGPKRTGAMYRALFDAELRRLIDERRRR